jgi:flagellar hook-basal body complex protein FliE
VRESVPDASRCIGEVANVNATITRVGDSGNLIPLKPPGTDKVAGSGESFSDVLGKFVNDVNSLQNKASESIEKLAAGEITDVHQVMIAVEEASTAMDFMLQIRNKIVDAYQEIMRMPV